MVIFIKNVLIGFLTIIAIYLLISVFAFIGGAVWGLVIFIWNIAIYLFIALVIGALIGLCIK